MGSGNSIVTAIVSLLTKHACVSNSDYKSSTRIVVHWITPGIEYDIICVDRQKHETPSPNVPYLVLLTHHQVLDFFVAMQYQVTHEVFHAISQSENEASIDGLYCSVYCSALSSILSSISYLGSIAPATLLIYRQPS